MRYKSCYFFLVVLILSFLTELCLSVVTSSNAQVSMPLAPAFTGSRQRFRFRQAPSASPYNQVPFYTNRRPKVNRVNKLSPPAAFGNGRSFYRQNMIDDDWYVTQLSNIQDLATTSVEFFRQIVKNKEKYLKSGQVSPLMLWQSRIFTSGTKTDMFTEFSVYKLHEQNVIIVSVSLSRVVELEDSAERVYSPYPLHSSNKIAETVNVDVFRPRIGAAIHLNKNSDFQTSAFLELGERAAALLKRPEIDGDTRIVILGTANVGPIQSAVFSLATTVFVQEYDKSLSKNYKLNKDFIHKSRPRPYLPRVYPFVVQAPNAENDLARYFTIPAKSFKETATFRMSFYAYMPETLRNMQHSVTQSMCKSLGALPETKSTKSFVQFFRKNRYKESKLLSGQQNTQLKIAVWVNDVFNKCFTATDPEFHKILRDPTEMPALEELDILFNGDYENLERAQMFAIERWKPALRVSFAPNSPSASKTKRQWHNPERDYGHLIDEALDFHYGNPSYFNHAENTDNESVPKISESSPEDSELLDTHVYDSGYESDYEDEPLPFIDDSIIINERYAQELSDNVENEIDSTKEKSD